MKAIKRFLVNWRVIPLVTYTNFKVEYPHSDCWSKWFSVERYWGGKIICICVRHRQLSFDFRRNWIADMIDPNR
jgi:hypothetical protein